MRVVSFNIKGAFVPGRMGHAEQERSWHLLAAFEAELALVQEVDPAAIPSWASERWTILKATAGVGVIEKTSWGSVVAAAPTLKLRSRDDLFADPWLAPLYEYIMIGEVDLPDGESALVASVHAAARTVRDFFSTNLRRTNPLSEEETKLIAGLAPEPWVADLAFAALDRVAKGKRFIIGGDWNNSRLFDLDPALRKKGQPPISTSFFTRACDAGWFECHGSKNEEQSFIGERARKPHQLDHVFCDMKTGDRLKDCAVRLDWLTPELSDHAPMVTDFDWH